MNNISLGEKVRTARKEKGLTQQAVVGDFMTRNMLSLIENNITKPSIKTIEFLSDRLNKPLSYFLDNELSVNNYNEDPLELSFQHSCFLIKNKEYSKCISYLENNLEHYQNESTSVFYGRLLYNLGHCYINKNHEGKATKLLDNALKFLREHKDFYYMCNTYYDLGYIHHLQQMYIEAECDLNKAINCLRNSHVPDILLEVKLYYGLGYALFEGKQYSKSIESLLVSLNLSKESHCFYNSGATHMLLGLSYKYIKDIDKAIFHTKKAISFFQFTENKNLEALSQKNLGNLFIANEKYSLAREYLNYTLNYFKETKDETKENAIKSDLLEILLKEGKPKEAIDYFEGINVNKLSDIDKCNLLVNLGKCFIEISDYTSALTHLKKALVIAEKLNHQNILYSIHNNLSEVYSKQNKYEKAYNSAKLAQDYLNKTTRYS